MSLQRARHVALAIDAGENDDGRFHLRHLDPVILDDGIGEELFRGIFQRRLGAGAVRALDFDVEYLALADAGDAADAERSQGALDGLTLRVEDAGFQRDGDAGFHGHSNR